MNSEGKMDQYSLWQDLIGQSMESHQQQEELLRRQEQLLWKVERALSVDRKQDFDTLWVLKEANNAVEKASEYSKEEHFEIGSKTTADLLSLLSNLEEDIPGRLRKIRDNILDIGDAGSKEIDRESLRKMKKGNATLLKNFGGRRGPFDTEREPKAKHLKWDQEQCRWENANAGETGDELDFEEDEIRSEIALKIITSEPICNSHWDLERNEWSKYSEERGSRLYFKDWVSEGKFKGIHRDELEKVALLYWVASRGDSKRRAAYTQIQIAKFLGWKEENNKVFRCVDTIKNKINELIPRHSDYKKYLASKGRRTGSSHS